MGQIESAAKSAVRSTHTALVLAIHRCDGDSVFAIAKHTKMKDADRVLAALWLQSNFAMLRPSVQSGYIDLLVDVIRHDRMPLHVQQEMMKWFTHLLPDDFHLSERQRTNVFIMFSRFATHGCARRAWAALQRATWSVPDPTGVQNRR